MTQQEKAIRYAVLAVIAIPLTVSMIYVILIFFFCAGPIFLASELTGLIDANSSWDRLAQVGIIVAVFVGSGIFAVAVAGLADFLEGWCHFEIWTLVPAVGLAEMLTIFAVAYIVTG